jgi:2-phosphoglycerate kinase
MGRAEKESKQNTVVISDKKSGLPFSRGILASSIAVAGLEMMVAHKIASDVQDYFIDNNIRTITLEELRSLAFRFIKDEAGLNNAEKYLLWQSVGKLHKPTIILVGGATGVGKSTVATLLASRLNITRVASTDAIREVMRASVSEKLIRPLRGSSYSAYKNLTLPPTGVEPVILGFREQVLAVNVGIEAIIKRSVEEKTDIVIEGAHVVPGYLDTARYDDKAIIISMLIAVPDKNVHKEHFAKRTVETQGSRPVQRYIKHLDKILMIQDYLEDLAAKNNVSIIQNYNLDNTVKKALELVFRTVKEQFDRLGTEYAHSSGD